MTPWLTPLTQWLAQKPKDPATAALPSGSLLLAASGMAHTAFLLVMKTRELAKASHWDQMPQVWEEALLILAAQTDHLRQEYSDEVIHHIWQQCLALETWLHEEKSSQVLGYLEHGINTLMAHIFDALFGQEDLLTPQIHQTLEVAGKMMDTVLTEVILPRLFGPKEPGPPGGPDPRGGKE